MAANLARAGLLALQLRWLQAEETGHWSAANMVCRRFDTSAWPFLALAREPGRWFAIRR